jgi:hypothetical protein
MHLLLQKTAIGTEDSIKKKRLEVGDRLDKILSAVRMHALQITTVKGHNVPGNTTNQTGIVIRVSLPLLLLLPPQRQGRPMAQRLELRNVTETVDLK